MKSKYFSCDFGSLLEGVNKNYGKLYNVYLLIKKQIFIGALIMCYNIPYLQILLPQLSTLVFIIFMYLFKPLDSFQEHIKMLTFQIGIGFIELIILIFALNDENRYLNYSQIISLGWLIISVNFIIISVYICFDLIINFLYIKKFIKKIQKQSQR